MLVLSRRVGEQILIGDDIVVTILDSRGDGVRIGIDAPRSTRVNRAEVVEAVRESNVAATTGDAAAEEDLIRLMARPSPSTAPRPVEP